MKTALLWFLVATAYTASAVPVNSEVPENRYVYPRFIQFPDGEGVLQNVDLEAPLDQEILDDVNRNPANNLYLLYTRRNPHSSQTLEIHNHGSITNSNFNPRVPTMVVVHGWLSNQDSDINPVVRDAALDRADVNVIVVDWRRLAISGYVTAANGVPALGRGLGQFLAFVNSVTGAPFETMHLVGFSLGAHLVGNAGKELGGRIGRITALDPAGPLWNLNSDRVNPNDARYVEAMHTDGGYTVGGLGIGTEVANADFFVNGGISQPGCVTNICNHNNSWRYFAATVRYNHIVGRECSSSWEITWDNCNGHHLNMGNDDVWKWGSGRFRANTDRRYPY